MGLWHGASWTFVFWGLYHCIFIFIHRLIAPLQFRTQFLGFNLGLLITLPITMLGWIPFGADDLGTTFALMGKVFDFSQYGS